MFLSLQSKQQSNTPRKWQIDGKECISGQPEVCEIGASLCLFGNDEL
jgi:hypothetical protein